MKVGVFGTGMVGNVIGSKLIELGHDVRMGARSATNEKAAAWAESGGARASHGTYADAAKFADLLFNCTAGIGSLEALHQAGEANLAGKILVDISNPLDFSKGMPPTLFVCNDDSLGEQIQRAFPTLKVVKTLNTVNCQLMINPAKLAADHDMFMCGNDAQAKQQVASLLTGEFGWSRVIDLGNITAARATESYLPLWIRLWGAMGTADFNIRIVKG